MEMPRRTTRSVERGITWLPRHDSYHVVAGLLVSSREADPLCVVQGVLATIEERGRGPEGSWSYGLLTGRLCICPRTDQRYLLVDGSRECPPPPDREGSGDDVHARMALELGARVAELERSGQVAVGYYVVGRSVVPKPEPADIGLLRALFPRPWQVMLVSDGAEHGGAGAFMRIEPINVRPYAIPFVELLPGALRRNADPPPSAVSWGNYHPTEPVAESRVRAPHLTVGPASAEAVETIGRRARRRLRDLMDRLAVGDRGRVAVAASPDGAPAAAPPPAPAPVPAQVPAMSTAPPPVVAAPVVAAPAPPSAAAAAAPGPAPLGTFPLLVPDGEEPDEPGAAGRSGLLRRIAGWVSVLAVVLIGVARVASPPGGSEPATVGPDAGGPTEAGLLRVRTASSPGTRA